MKADREPNKLPFRAGAMLLLALAVVFFGLAWHSAASGDDDPEQKLAEAGAKMPAASVSTSAEATTTTSSGGSAETPPLCVFNAGTVSGLASEVTTTLEDAGFEVSDPGNLSTSSITENTVFYDSGDRSAAQKVAKALGGSVSVEARPDSFTDCSDGMPVIVVTR